MNNEIKEIFDLYEKQTDNLNLAILIRTLKEWYFEKEDYKSRNEKAIEYGKELRLFDNESLEFEIGTNFINILQGDDKE